MWCGNRLTKNRTRSPMVFTVVWCSPVVELLAIYICLYVCTYIWVRCWTIGSGIWLDYVYSGMRVGHVRFVLHCRTCGVLLLSCSFPRYTHVRDCSWRPCSYGQNVYTNGIVAVLICTVSKKNNCYYLQPKEVVLSFTTAPWVLINISSRGHESVIQVYWRNGEMGTAMT